MLEVALRWCSGGTHLAEVEHEVGVPLDEDRPRELGVAPVNGRDRCEWGGGCVKGRRWNREEGVNESSVRAHA